MLAISFRRLALLTAMALVLAAPTLLVARPAAASTASAPQIIPKPVSMTAGHGTFFLTPHTRIVPSGRGASGVAASLAGYLRPATGYPLQVRAGQARPGDIAISTRDPGSLGDDTSGEGYQLDVTRGGVLLQAPTAHGLFDGVQTIRQLLPPWITSTTVRSGPWTMPAVHVVDYPRYRYRGLMLDIARHYESPAAAMRLLDQAAAYKINTFHLHLSDDQGFRLVINGFPNLAKIGGQGSVGTGGRTMDPGGYWTQDDYRAFVAYAKARFVTVVPEVDSPGHNNAIIMSEYDDVANPLLNGHPQDINCGKNDPPQWNYTGAVGYSAMCPESQNTWTIMSAIIQQLSELTPGPYYHVGGDEVPSTILTQDRYAAFLNTEAPIVRAQGKAVMGWAEIAGQGTALGTPTVAEYWNPASGSSAGTATATEAVAKGMQIVMAPATHAYLDQKYVAGSSGSVPPSLGLSWACSRGCDVDQFYNWNPGGYVTGVTDDNVIGVEGAIWGETTTDLDDVDYMVFPRLPALAEVAWSPAADRSGTTSAAYQDFVGRLAAQGARFLASGTNFYPTPEVPWRLDLTGASLSGGGAVDGTVATLSAPGVAAGDVAASIRWGDGSTGSGAVSGTAATDKTVNGLYSVTGSHTYAHPGFYLGTVTATAPGKDPATTHFLVVVR
ncbi:MAG TPA: family 20 glycosylhydrolase [Streptosporangiales bacterium]